MVAVDVIAHRVESARCFGQQCAVFSGHRSFVQRRNLTEVLGDKIGHAIDQIAPRRGQLLVVVAHELGPGEVGVGAFGAGDGNVIAHGVHRVVRENVLDINHDAARGGELLALHRHELARHHLLRHVQRAIFARLAALGALAVVGEHFGGPNLRMEGDVVLAHEIVGGGFGIVPPFAPRFGLALAPRPFDGGRQVADHRVEPHIQLLVRVVDPAVHRHRDAPVDVARDGARLDLLEQAL